MVQARPLWNTPLLPLLLGNFIESNPVPVKAALAMMGIFSSAVYRLPLVPLAAEHAETMRAELHELGLLQEIETPMENDER